MNWLTTEEACRYLKIVRSTLMDLRKAGRMKAYPLFKGRGTVWPILRWFESVWMTFWLAQNWYTVDLSG